MTGPESVAQEPHLERRLGLFQATALNMANMIGVGPFITIPMLMSALGGPQSMLGWAIALLITIPDSMVWSELGAAMPGSGGTYRWLREGFGREKLGRLMAFLFLWQFLISGPLEIASGYIGFAKYLDFLWPGTVDGQGVLTLRGGAVVIALGLMILFLLYRRIQHVGFLTVSLWLGAMLTVGAILLTGIMHFDAGKAFDFPPNAFDFSWGFLLGLGTATRVGIYDFLGYYDICFVGDEVRDPGKTIPRSIIGSLILVALIYIGINLSINGIISWREFVPHEERPIAAHIASHVMERIHGPSVAKIFTVMILWTTVGSCFALLLGYSRIPFAAARDGTFFRMFARLHPSKNFPHLSLLVIGGLSIIGAFLPLGAVVDALITLRIVILFIGQIAALVLLRRARPTMPRPYKVWLYPLPLFVAVIGWLFALVTSGARLMLLAALCFSVGIVAYFAWAKFTGIWPWGKGMEPDRPSEQPS